MLAHMSEEESGRILPHLALKRLTPNTVGNLQELEEAELRRVRVKNGYACDLEEHELHIRCIAAPVWDHAGAVNASLSITAPLVRMAVTRLLANWRSGSGCRTANFARTGVPAKEQPLAATKKQFWGGCACEGSFKLKSATFCFRTVCLQVGMLQVVAGCFAQSSPAAASGMHAPCQAQAVNFEGWKAEELFNDWVRLTVVPQLGGRLMQVQFGEHRYLFVNPRYKDNNTIRTPGDCHDSK